MKGLRRAPAARQREDARTKPLRIAPSRARRVRRGFGIHAYIGANGGGKSLAMIYDTLPSLAAGRPIVSTVRILDPSTGEPHKLWVPLADYRTLLDVEFCDVLLDEVTGVASSRESQSMPVAIQNHLQQLRRADVRTAWTAPSWNRADTIIRECSQAVTLCLGFVPEVVTVDRTFDGPHGRLTGGWACEEEGEHSHHEERAWRSRKAFYWRTYDAAAFDEWTASKREKVNPVARQVHWRPGGVAARSYDTYDSVLSLGVVTEFGQCLDCGGTRPRPKCVCHRDGDHETPPAPRQRRPRVHRVEIPETDYTPGITVELPDQP